MSGIGLRSKDKCHGHHLDMEVLHRRWTSDTRYASSIAHAHVLHLSYSEGCCPWHMLQLPVGPAC